MVEAILRPDLTPELNDARKAGFRILFDSKETDREGGHCALMDSAVRYLYDNDFIILIHKPAFDQQTDIEKLRIIVHELYHITLDDNNQPKVRRHEGDFCEIASRDHDKLSYAIAERIADRVLPQLAKFRTQTELPTKTEQAITA